MSLRALPLAARLGHAARFILVSLLLGASLLISANAHAAKLGVGKTGSGIVTSSPSGINCGTSCSAGYGNGTNVTLTASAAAGYSFSGWSGACSGTSATCMLSVTGSRSVAATFKQNIYTLTVGKTGSGTVTSSPSGINCGTSCSASYTSGTNVTLIAAAASGYRFSGWSGACSGTNADCTDSMTEARSVTAMFSQNDVNYTLTVSKSGSGTVASSPAGINCGTSCSAVYTSGTNVTLVASAATGYSFSGWSGACSGSSASCTVSMTAARSVSATFSQNVVNYTLSVTTAGSGTVASSPAGINCGTSASCTVSMTAARSVSATFSQTISNTTSPTSDPQCSSSGLAAIDLSGQCRSTTPTMGALEAVASGI